MPKFCSIVETVKTIGTKPRLVILRTLGLKGWGFNDLKQECGISSRTLALNLRFLQGKGLVDSAQAGRKTIYGLTPKAAELTPLLAELGAWGKKWGVWKAGKARAKR